MYFNIKSLKIKLFKSYTGTKLRHLNIIASENRNLQTHCGLFFILWNVNTEFLCGGTESFNTLNYVQGRMNLFEYEAHCTISSNSMRWFWQLFRGYKLHKYKNNPHND